MGGETDLSDYLNQLNQKNLKKRREAIRSVIDILNEGDALAIDPLIDALSDDDLYIQIKAAKGLGIIKDVRGIEPLINALKDLSVEVRIEAAKALECMKYYTSIEPICNSFNNKNNKDIKRRCHTSSQISEKNDKDITIVRNSESLVHELYLRSQNTNYISCIQVL
jgi:HEAT repeat protein